MYVSTQFDIIGASVASPTLAMRMEYCLCICSVQSGNLRNLEVVFRILRILRLRSNLEIAHYSCAISRLRTTVARSRDCATIVRNLQIAQVTHAHYS